MICERRIFNYYRYAFNTDFSVIYSTLNIQLLGCVKLVSLLRGSSKSSSLSHMLHQVNKL